MRLAIDRQIVAAVGDSIRDAERGSEKRVTKLAILLKRWCTCVAAVLPMMVAVSLILVPVPLRTMDASEDRRGSRAKLG